MVQDIAGVIRSLHTTAVNRCRERLDDAALRARGLITRVDPETKPHDTKEQYGVTSILKKRHGL
jgi:hypothetical protein